MRILRKEAEPRRRDAKGKKVWHRSTSRLHSSQNTQMHSHGKQPSWEETENCAPLRAHMKDCVSVTYMNGLYHNILKRLGQDSLGCVALLPSKQVSLQAVWNPTKTLRKPKSRILREFHWVQRPEIKNEKKGKHPLSLLCFFEHFKFHHGRAQASLKLHFANPISIGTRWIKYVFCKCTLSLMHLHLISYKSLRDLLQNVQLMALPPISSLSRHERFSSRKRKTMTWRGACQCLCFVQDVLQHSLENRTLLLPSYLRSWQTNRWTRHFFEALHCISWNGASRVIGPEASREKAERRSKTDKEGRQRQTSRQGRDK